MGHDCRVTEPEPKEKEIKNMKNLNLNLIDWRTVQWPVELVEIDGREVRVAVVEFRSKAAMVKFLNDVGGCPHPLGGCRVCIER